MRKLVQLKDINDNNLDPKNLNYENRIAKLEPTILYSNPNGSGGNITLSDSASNYDYLEIDFYGSDRGSGKREKCVHTINGYIELECIGFSSEQTRNYLYSTRYRVNDTNLTVDQARTTTLYASTLANINNNNIFITKIVGYKS